MAKLQGIDSFEKLCQKFARTEIDRILYCSKKLGLPQKIIFVVLHNFYKGRELLRIEPDDLVFFSACIDLACKIIEFPLHLSKILRSSSEILNVNIQDNEVEKRYISAVDMTELDLCMAVEFDFSTINYHDDLRSVAETTKLTPNEKKTSWILTNDIITYTPASLFFSESEILQAALFVVHCLIQVDKIENSPPKTPESLTKTDKTEIETNCSIKNEEFFDGFFKFSNVDIHTSNRSFYLCEKLLDIYFNCLQDRR